jgi:transcription factor TFIIIB component B''
MAEDSSTQPPAQAADKAQAPATFSSFINKNTSGKKFAPKAARRRPAAAAAAKPAVTASIPISQPEPEPEPSSAPAEPTAAAPLPTPAPTQPATQATPAPVEASNDAIATQDPTPAAAPEPAPVPTPAVEAPQSPPPQHAPQPSTQRVDVPQSVEDDIEAGRSSKRRRIEAPPRQSTPMVPVAVMVPPQDAHTGEIIPQQPAPPADTLSAPSAELGEPSANTDATPTETETPAPSKRRRRTLPWTAVNHPQEEGGEASGAADPPAKKKRAPPKPRGKKAAEVVEDGGPQETGDGEEAEPTQKRPSARARGKRRAEAPEIGEGGQPVEPPPKKPRKPRKDKGKQPAAEGETVEAEGGEEGDVAVKPKPTAKPRAPKRKKSTPAEGEEGSVEPKKRGRPPREDTPSDAEDHVIDPDAMCMDDLASRNIRVGKLSRREREMRKIDWDAVKQRRREEDARHITTKEAQAAVDKLLESGDVEQVSTGPRYHVVDGRIELVQDSGTIDRERDADREIEMMTITEEDDLTTRITSRSFMKNNKRFPNEFVLPGQGKRWNAQSTEMFYQGLRSFGTDFQMIAHMFPGMTRRSIKTKFTREERENPDIVRDCLRGESTLASHWGEFLEASQLQDDSFADSDRIKKELEEEEARMREQINEALKEKEEREHQKRLAGVTEDGDANEKENGKGKKKRKQKDKTVTFQEEGVEILGEVDDDPNWGQE